MYKIKNGTDSADRVYSGSASKGRVSEAERLRAKGEALRHSKRYAKGSNRVSRNREEEQKRSEQLRERSGSRYADKQEGLRVASPVSYSRYADKQESSEEALRPGLWHRWMAGLKRGDSLAVAALSVLVVFVVCYSIVALFYSSHFYSGTTILGIPCGKLDVETAKEAVSSRIGEYTLQVDGRSGSEKITADEVGLSYKDEGGIEALLSSQKSWIWPVMMFLRKDTVLEVGTQYDHARIGSVVRGMECFRTDKARSPKDAYLGTDDTGYIVVPEDMGSLPDAQAVKSLLEEALDQGKTRVSLEAADCYVKPKVYSDDPLLNRVAQERNELLGAQITLPFGNFNEVVGTEKLISFMTETRDGEYYISSDRIRAYVDQLANKYDTYGGYRSFRTSLGTAVDLYGGDYGWLLDRAATADELAEAIRQKKTMTMDPIYTHTAMSRGLNDIGDTYVEICISLQEMWCYQDGELMVDTPVVTGNPNRDNATPSGGVWEIDAKMQDYTLVGPDYRTPVSFWMPFNGGVGIHDLQARYYFGGTIYLYNGSHGCVNTPMDAVEQIYNIVSVGTPVIVYE